MRVRVPWRVSPSGNTFKLYLNEAHNLLRFARRTLADHCIAVGLPVCLHFLPFPAQFLIQVHESHFVIQDIDIGNDTCRGGCERSCFPASMLWHPVEALGCLRRSPIAPGLPEPFPRRVNGRTSGLPSNTRGRSRMDYRLRPDERGVSNNAHSLLPRGTWATRFLQRFRRDLSDDFWLISPGAATVQVDHAPMPFLISAK